MKKKEVIIEKGTVILMEEPVRWFTENMGHTYLYTFILVLQEHLYN